MHRIDGPGATTENKFTEGDPTVGVPATNVTGDWLNAIQEEISAAIEDAGLTLAKPDNTQLAEAIRIIAGQSVGWGTGDVKLTMKTAADDGWLMCNDGTIGPAGSGATARAHADTRSLYLLLWGAVSNANAPVTGGRGVSAVADWDSGKAIALTKMVGRALCVAGSGDTLTSRSLGQVAGSETHVLAVGEMPSHGHAVTDPKHGHTVSDPGHAHLIGGSFNGSGTSSNGGYLVPGGTNVATSSAATGVSIATAATGISIQANGGGGAHNNVQPSAFLNVMIKL